VFSHITVGTQNLVQANVFYDAVLPHLRLRRRVVTPDGGPEASCWVNPTQTLPRFYVYSPLNRAPASAGNGAMVAFLAPNRAAVDHAYRAALKHGATDEGAPGERENYGVGYYGAYFRDLDGNKIHVAFRGDLL
jgi:catechol 2,3-dioxygenase-like lactoylglutathione lyase family enzyme